MVKGLCRLVIELVVRQQRNGRTPMRLFVEMFFIQIELASVHNKLAGVLNNDFELSRILFLFIV